jgi:hypothetical protein
MSFQETHETGGFPFPYSGTSVDDNSRAKAKGERHDEDWTSIENRPERRRLQNRIAQRKYRKDMFLLEKALADRSE